MTRTEWIINNRDVVTVIAKNRGLTDEQMDDFFQYLCEKSLGTDKSYPENRVRGIVTRYVRWRARDYKKRLQISNELQLTEWREPTTASRSETALILDELKNGIRDEISCEFSARDCEVIQLRMSGMRYKEIGAKLDISAVNARIIVFRFRKFLANCGKFRIS